MKKKQKKKKQLLHGATPASSSSSSFSPFLFFFFIFYLFFFIFYGSDSIGSSNCQKRSDHDSQNREVWPWFARIPIYFPIELFLMLKELQKWTVQGFSGRTVQSGPSFKILNKTNWNLCLLVKYNFMFDLFYSWCD